MPYLDIQFPVSINIISLLLYFVAYVECCICNCI